MEGEAGYVGAALLLKGGLGGSVVLTGSCRHWEDVVGAYTKTMSWYWVAFFLQLLFLPRVHE